jgi:hypothetical protein
MLFKPEGLAGLLRDLKSGFTARFGATAPATAQETRS